MGRMIRRLVNIVAERGCSGMYTLHRLDVSKHLFYPSSRAATEAAKNKTNGKVSILPWLPAPVMRFEPSPTTLWDAGRLEMFALVSPRSCEDRILCSNTAGHTTVYNAYSNCVQAMPNLNSGKGFMPMAISIARPASAHHEEDLYVMNTAADLGDGMCCFEVLRFGSLGGDDSEEEGPMVGLRGWRWDPLPPPPVSANICAHTVVDGGSTICVSAVPSSGAGTFCFDTRKREWTRAGGGWVLPFDGAAEYVPDLKLWMGFSSDNQQLCAWDLSAMDKPPTLRHSWIDLKTPEEWSASRLSLLNLGGGRFCIAKTFRVLSDTGGSFDSDSVEDMFAVLTGIEMVTSGVGRSDNGLEEGLKMVRHKSIRYMFTNEMIRWVL
ncbi:unnamed protein product [Urochloa decumbens]|uniref:Uncharacterized protein n=1 Tax=Urochloa decumbens TaxID=240449 RepID=A0ABC9GBZ4_9POAL